MMDSEELKRIKSLIAKSESLNSEIKNLKECIEVGRKTKAVRFNFSEWSLWYENGDSERLSHACSDKLLEDLAPQFRAAFLAIVEKRLEERQKEFDTISV